MRFGDSEELFVSPQAGVRARKLTQPQSLETMVELVQGDHGSVDPLVRTTAIQIIRAAGCEARDDDCELHALYDAVKQGHPGVTALKNGFMYVNDPRYADYFTAAGDSLRACLKGACGGDCDDASILIGSLAASIGWQVGMRGWGQPGAKAMLHVYPVVAYPKRPGPEGYTRDVALDVTVPSAYVGWQPPESDQVVTCWAE